MCDQFDYEVAFSFLVEDEDLASELNSLVSERLSTFFYSERQDDLVGADGERHLSDVFGRRARTVAVLHRSTWGTTPWTRIEETAIRNRAYDVGYDFVLFIPLDDHPSVPAWLPRTRIWYNLPRFGVQAAAAIIEARVIEAGGEVRAPTPAERAAALQRRIESQSRRETFRSSREGVAAATNARRELFAAVRDVAGNVTQASPVLDFTFSEDRYGLVLGCCGHSLTIDWSNQYTNTLEYSKLITRRWRGTPARGAGINIREPVELGARELDYTLDDAGSDAWLSTAERRYFSSRQLADYLMHWFLDLIDPAPRVRSR